MKQCPIDKKWKPHVHTSDEISDFIKNPKSKKELLFELARRIVFEESGDGTVIIVSRKYDVLADEFFKYEINLENPIYIRKSVSNDGTSIAFSSHEEFSQESIIFALDIGVLTIEMYDSVIFLRL